VVFLAITGFVAHKHSMNNSEPVLKVLARTPSTLIWGGTEEYYIVRNNGFAQKTSAFTPTKVESYGVDDKNSASLEILINHKTGERLESSSFLYRIIYDIIELVETQSKINDPNIGTLYLLNERYFFNVFDPEGSLFSTYSDVIFEYLPEENRIVRLTTFDAKTIDHMEAYETK
jgi:hypothetical protein